MKKNKIINNFDKNMINIIIVVFITFLNFIYYFYLLFLFFRFLYIAILFIIRVNIQLLLMNCTYNLLIFFLLLKLSLEVKYHHFYYLNR